jgi:hypothetical protein
VAIPGRTYTAAPGQVLDVPDFDAHLLRARGWIAGCFGLPAGVQGGGPGAEAFFPLGGMSLFGHHPGDAGGLGWRRLAGPGQRQFGLMIRRMK